MTALNWDRARKPPREAPWRRLPATQKQLDYIGRLCGWPREQWRNGMTRGEASDLIEQLRRHDPAAQLDRQDRTRADRRTRSQQRKRTTD